MKEEFIRDNAKLEKIKAQQKEKERGEMRKIEEYAVKKSQKDDMIKEALDKKFQEKQAIKQRLIDQQAEYLRNLKNKEDEILSKHIKEAEEKRNKELEDKQKRFDELKKQIDDNREYQVARKKGLKEKELQDDKQFVELWKDKMVQLEKDENDEQMDIKTRSKNLQNFLIAQMNDKKEKSSREFLIDNEEALKTKLMMQNENEEFLDYAELWVKEYYKSGKDIKPLLLELKNYKKKLVTS